MAEAIFRLATSRFNPSRSDISFGVTATTRSKIDKKVTTQHLF